MKIMDVEEEVSGLGIVLKFPRRQTCTNVEKNLAFLPTPFHVPTGIVEKAINRLVMFEKLGSSGEQVVGAKLTAHLFCVSQRFAYLLGAYGSSVSIPQTSRQILED